LKAGIAGKGAFLSVTGKEGDVFTGSEGKSPRQELIGVGNN
jgi:hypothetical protein